MARVSDAEAHAAKAKVLKKDPGSKGFKFFRKLVGQIKDTRAGKDDAPAKKPKGESKKALRTVNPSSKKKRSLSTVTPKKAKKRSRASGVGVQ